jgi:hypothetical protein
MAWMIRFKIENKSIPDSMKNQVTVGLIINMKDEEKAIDKARAQLQKQFVEEKYQLHFVSSQEMNIPKRKMRTAKVNIKEEKGVRPINEIPKTPDSRYKEN